jgi:SlyX protein
MSANLEQRLTELEVRCAFIEQTLQSLDSTVIAQDRVLADLRRENERLRVELAQLRSGVAADVHDEPPPPHY